MNIPEHWKNLSPRQQLRDVVQTYARLNGGDMKAAWFKLERMYFRRYGVDLTAERKRYAAKHGTLPTIPLWFEMQGIMERALALAMTMGKSC